MADQLDGVERRRAAALHYARQGIPVFPCVPGGKEPATPHGFLDATTDPEQIEKIWAGADYNIGVSPEAFDAFVVDIDPRNSGNSSWELLQAIQGWVEKTLRVRTPSGGIHFYFRGSAPPSVSRLGQGIDVRGRGSYVLLPPSVVNGVEYAYIVD